MDRDLQLAEQFTKLTIELGQMLQSVWQFDAIVTFGAIGWALSVTRYERAPTIIARLLVAIGLGAFYALNVYVLWNLLQRLRAAQSLAHHYAALSTAHDDQAALAAVYQDFPNYVVQGSAGIGAAVVAIVVILMSSAGVRRSASA